MDQEEKSMKALQQVQLNIEVYKRLLQTDMPERGKDLLRQEIEWLENVVIPQETIYDV
jgi:hypothetical protein